MKRPNRHPRPSLWTALRRPPHRRTRARTDEALSLIEVVVALVLLLIAMIPMGYMLDSAVTGAADARSREAALQLADAWMEVLTNSTPPTATVGGVQTNNVVTNQWTTPAAPTNAQAPRSTLAGTPFTVQVEYTMQAVTNQSDLCSVGQPPSSSHPGVIVLQVKVTWDHGNETLTDTTAIDYPQPGLQTEGYIAVQLTNNGQDDAFGDSYQTRLQSVPVTIQETSASPTLSPNPLKLYSDQYGCVFAQVPTGTYTVSVAQPATGTPADFTGWPGSPSFVTPAGATSQSLSSQTVTVANEQQVSLTAFDEGINSSITYGAASGVDGGVSCPGSSLVTCIATGNGTNGAAAAWGGTGATWTTATLSAATNINQVACTSASSPTCVAVGENASGKGVILTTSSILTSTNADTVPTGVTDITQVTCPTANGCYALGTTATGPVLLAGAVGQTSPNTDTWAVVAPSGTTFTALSSLVCPLSTTCELTGAGKVGSGTATPGILRLDGDPATLATTSTWTPTFTADTLPTAVTAVGQLACPSSTECLALATGDTTSATDPTVIVTGGSSGAGISSTSGTASTWSGEPNFPTGNSSLTGLTCAGTTCLALGTLSGAPAMWTADLTASPDDWELATIPASVAVLTSAACGQPAAGDTADCVVATLVPGSATTGQLLEGSLTNGSWSWNFASSPGNAVVTYYDSVACESSPSSSRSACAAVGATASGPVIATATNGPSDTWNLETPGSLSNAIVTGIPLETTPATQTAWTTQVAAGQATNATSLPNLLYPQPSGYYLVAGDCSAAATSESTGLLNVAAGGTATPVVPVGLLPLQVVSKTTGAAVSGATVTLTNTTCPSADTYTLPVTDANGLTRTSVPFGTYSVKVKVGATTTTPSYTIQVDNTSVTVSGVTTYLPGPVQVTSS